METRANNIAIGAFVLTVVAIAFLFTFWLLSAGDRSGRRDIKIIFPGAVTGLPIGGQVLFNGIKIGDVSALTYDPSNPKLVVAIVRVDANAPLRRDTVASLGFTGLTGVAYVDLSGGSTESPALFSKAEETIPVMYARRSQFEDLLEGAKDIMRKADSTLSNIDELVISARPDVQKTIKNVEAFTDALAKNASGVDDFLAGITETSKALTGLSGKLGNLVDRGEVLLANVPPDKLGQIVNNVEVMTNKLSASADGVGDIVANGKLASDQLLNFTTELSDELAQIEAVIAAVKPEEVERILKGASDLGGVLTERRGDINSMLASASLVVDNARELIVELTKNEAVIDRIVKNAEIASQEIVLTTQNANRILDKVNPEQIGNIVTSVETVTKTLSDKDQVIAKAIDDAGKASANIRQVSDLVAGRNKEIDRVIVSADEIGNNLTVVSGQLTKTMDNANALIANTNEVVAAIDPVKVTSIVTSANKVATTLADKTPELAKAIDEIQNAAKSVNDMSIEIKKKVPDVTKVIDQAKNIASNLNAASVRVNTILEKVDGMVSADGKGFIKEATDAAASIREVADAFAKRAEPISVALLKLSQQGGQDFTAAMQQLNQTLIEIRRTVSNFDRNPNRVIFGGSDTPVFNGAQRR
ncbi:mce related protein [Pseudovibrio axinellae]|uniref:Mce related protein n=1 Tax=Pseudovibrio axinellae TaxID=989403 RepID=A0A161VB96_9HYPH|nr:MlaD family protein [Pseudovibrio axinellae]KZL21384.1 mce related protein [Pseudovibrio axinellae]SEQ98230.1 phospholipid/cholesterol/gamma-HCH transport system substrate-binding protein [Pseudovibrio axinellae]